MSETPWADIAGAERRLRGLREELAITETALARARRDLARLGTQYQQAYVDAVMAEEDRKELAHQARRGLGWRKFVAVCAVYGPCLTIASLCGLTIHNQAWAIVAIFWLGTMAESAYAFVTDILVERATRQLEREAKIRRLVTFTPPAP